MRVGSSSVEPDTCESLSLDQQAGMLSTLITGLMGILFGTVYYQQPFATRRQRV